MIRSSPRGTLVSPAGGIQATRLNMEYARRIAPWVWRDALSRWNQQTGFENVGVGPLLDPLTTMPWKTQAAMADVGCSACSPSYWAPDPQAWQGPLPMARVLRNPMIGARPAVTGRARRQAMVKHPLLRSRK